MKVEQTGLPGLLLLTPTVHRDARGDFAETYNARAFDAAVGRAVSFVQDNQSFSRRGVLRGLHYQLPRPQGKLVRAAAGAVWDVAVDLRRASPTFGRWHGVELSAANGRQLWLPEGFAHGFVALDDALLVYKTTDYWAPDAEHTLAWDDAALAIDWPLSGAPVLSDKDRAGVRLADAPLFD
ncbi:dTDP-4-dehydrorhamnose 3,5-epimerase [Crenobacter luteus]|uniref:dTDP-4-dehydrorhamnose 3,5-epimerase n=1 Tax=Crenobacter luteus TaxID=1452487 RepID=A0A161R8X7_9NEIS|nr:dTDP-4-dehydrorhamnose 3,5-epimerase [Crenobacter luteus]KZE33218.1 dTDP-4-dehydrorhamnose 3,5-epimerase [Crenobacter luteus]TCP08485.1 dTDP-4-dehydrorhamnose 3,5-epimerase [Crenobacter luteus]